MFDLVRCRPPAEPVDGDQMTVLGQLDPSPAKEVLSGLRERCGVPGDERGERLGPSRPQRLEADDGDAPDDTGNWFAEVSVIEEVRVRRQELSA
jgi:hypothetical protein